MEEFYKKKVIRDFLALFSESKWKNLCVLCIEYGILILKKNYQVSSLSMDDIEQFVDDLIQEDARKTKKNLKKFDIGNKLQSDTSITSNTNSRPSSNWRKGDTKTIFDGNDNENDNVSNNKQSHQQSRDHYSKHSGNSSYYADTDMSIISRKTKAIDDILYPKQKAAMTYKNDYVFGSGGKKYNHKSDYSTTYSNNYNSNKLKKKEYTNTYHRNNYHRNNSSNRNDYSFSKHLSTSNSNSNMKFSSGLQMLKMRAPSATSKHGYTRSNSTKRNINNTVNNITNIYESKYKNISSKIKNQIETDKKIYEMMKNKKRDDRKTFEDRESSITYRKSEMSFEEGFSSLV